MTEDNRLTLYNKNVELTPTSLTITGDMTIEEYLDYAKTLESVEGATQWWIGDYLNEGEWRQGEMYAQAVDESQAKSWQSYKWVAKKVDSSIRIEQLGWSYHQLVAHLEQSEQGYWLQEAVDNCWSHRELRAAIRSNNNQLPATTGKSDQDIFKALGWGLRTWDLWNWASCDERFGTDWPGRIPAQLVAHALYYFTRQGDRVLDPMAGGGVVPDVCNAFARNCDAFDINVSPQRPEIMYHYWQPGNMTWPQVEQPDMIFFDPPYYKKMQQDYEDKAGDLVPVSSLGKEDYLQFFADFFELAYHNTKPTTRMAFLNADWRDYEGKAASEETPENNVTMLDYAHLLSRSGWGITHIIDCPLPSEQMFGSTVLAYQNKRTLGVLRRTLFIANKYG